MIKSEYIQYDKFQDEIRIDIKGEINMNNYRIISDIGSGAYSTVHKAIDVNTGHIVAIKKIS
jgi:serine/threonine protein kinase